MIRKSLLSAICFSVIALSACNKNTPVADDQGIDLTLTPVEQQRVVADNAFSLKLFKNVLSSTTTDNNIMVSPLSACFAVGMLNNGANGQTLTDINSTMNFNGFTQDQVNSYYNKLLTDLPRLDPSTDLKIANSIWLNQNISILPQFTQTNSSFYQAKLQNVNFSLPTTKDVMNQWVSDQTNGKIPSILDQTHAGDVMYLINAIYFKGIWNERFDSATTRSQAFYLANNIMVQTSFMSSHISYNSYKDDQAQIIELPYKNKKYSMVIVMPIASKTVPDVVNGLNTDKWASWMSHLNSGIGDVIMPKFKFSYNIDLVDPLKQLGMGIAFSNQADFTRINTSGGMQISSAKHKTYIEVNEEGTEAAAVTSIGISTTSAPTYVTIDHPFLFAIREMKYGLILFTGVVNNPLLTGK